LQFHDGHIIHSPSDLANFAACGHLTQLDLQALNGALKKPYRDDPGLELLRQRGEAFEQEKLAAFEAQGLRVVRIGRDDPDPAQSTLQAMRTGADVIYQARLVMDDWRGWADFLLRVDSPCPVLGSHSYEVADTKLSTQTRGGAILQIALYTEMLGRLQGRLPAHLHVIRPNGEERHLTSDFIHYLRVVMRRYRAAVDAGAETYPEPVPHCAICQWNSHCEQRRRDDDHLRYVAGLSAEHARELRRRDIPTLEAFAGSAPFAPERGAQATYDRLREQARVQWEARKTGTDIYETLPPVTGQGLFRLPAPDNGDLYLDLEGDPYIPTAGREYLFGWVDRLDGGYHHYWALDDAGEKDRFEAFIDLVVARLETHPGMHVYHFGSYEPSAFKRLMSRYATREDEMDRLLRAGVFVDLHPIVRQSVRAGIESYSIKQLERYYGYERQQELAEAGRIRAALQWRMEGLEPMEGMDENTWEVVRAYNEDDCRSTHALHQWLEGIREQQIGAGHEIPRPEVPVVEPDADAEALRAEDRALMQRLLEGVPADRAARDEWQQARWLLANMIPWYRREKKSFWWEHFERLKATEEELLNDGKAIFGLTPVGDPVNIRASREDTYEYPDQDTDIDVGDRLRNLQNTYAGQVCGLDRETRRLTIRVARKGFINHPDAVIQFNDYPPGAKLDSIRRLATLVVDGDIKALRHPGVDLLTRRAPVPHAPVPPPGNGLDRLMGWLGILDRSCVPVQGPPGAGKTYTASHAILRLVQSGKKVGVTAMSHRAIENLLEAVADRFTEAGLNPDRILQKPAGGDDTPRRWRRSQTPELNGQELISTDVFAGTPFMWASFANPYVDHLFVDEAGQLSLIDTLAISSAGRNLVLLGDPRQLTQPQQGLHPEGTEVSALEQLLGKALTIPEDRGVFLDRSWRMHPEICAFVSGLYYEGRLQSIEGLGQQRIEGSVGYDGAGLVLEECLHEGNRTSSEEEVERVREIVQVLTADGVRWYDGAGVERPLTMSDIRVVTPYNRQVRLLEEALPGLSIGTVDRFQGQEAAVVICSMATSTAEDAPRGMEFLYSPNRFNVAVSRAKVRFILVANPALMTPMCRTVVEMRLANGFCGYGG